MLHYTYIASDNTAANGTSLGSAGQDIVVKSVIFGLGADAVYATIYDETNPFTGATTNIAAKLTQPTAGAGKNYVQVFDVNLPLGNGGNVVTSASQVTVVWDDLLGQQG